MSLKNKIDEVLNNKEVREEVAKWETEATLMLGDKENRIITAGLCAGSFVLGVVLTFLFI
jgi:hypothetical protein